MSVKATAVAHPAATKLLCVEQTLARPRIDTLYGKQILGRQRALVRTANQQTTIEWTMVNAMGQPINLEECGYIAASSQSSSAAGSDAPVVNLRIRESTAPMGLGPQFGTWCVDGVVDEASTGRVSATYDTTVGPTHPGVYWAEFALLNRDGEVVFTNTFRLLLERSLWGPCAMSGPPTLAEIRLHMRDSDPVESMLLDNFEFADAEIIASIERPVLYWNEVPPPIPDRFTTQSFPFRFHWLEGIVGCLLQTATFHFQRNQLEYQAGGMAVNDLNRLEQYVRSGDQRWANYKEFVMRKKAQINIERGWGSIGSFYSWWK